MYRSHAGSPSANNLADRASRLGIAPPKPQPTPLGSSQQQQQLRPSPQLVRPPIRPTRAAAQGGQQYSSVRPSGSAGASSTPLIPAWGTKREMASPLTALQNRVAAKGTGRGPIMQRPLLVPRAKKELFDPSFASSYTEAAATSEKVEEGTEAGEQPGLQSQKTPAEIERQALAAKRREEALYRDVSCKAICQVKQAIREKQKELQCSALVGVNITLENWSEDFFETLGDFVRFLHTRPDQFHIHEGQGTFAVRNVAGNITVVAPAWGSWKKKNWRQEGEEDFSQQKSKSTLKNVLSANRERIAGEELVRGKAIRWCGGFGWIHPDKPVDHPLASKHRGDLFVHGADLIGCKILDPGDEVEFVIYMDKSGLGAEECQRVGDGGSGGKAGGKKGRGRGGFVRRGPGGKGAPADDASTTAESSGVKRPALEALGLLNSSNAKRADTGRRSKWARPSNRWSGKQEPPKDKDASPRLLPAQMLKPLAPLRLATPLKESYGYSNGGIAKGTGNDHSVVVEMEEDGNIELDQQEAEEVEEDDDVEALGFVVDGEALSDQEEEDNGVEALGFTIDGDGDGYGYGQEPFDYPLPEEEDMQGQGEGEDEGEGSEALWRLLAQEASGA